MDDFDSPEHTDREPEDSQESSGTTVRRPPHYQLSKGDLLALRLSRRPDAALTPLPRVNQSRLVRPPCPTPRHWSRCLYQRVPQLFAVFSLLME